MLQRRPHGDASQVESEQTLDGVRERHGRATCLLGRGPGRARRSSPAARDFCSISSPRKQTPRLASRDPALIGFPRRAGKTYAALFRTAARSRNRNSWVNLLLVIDVGPILSEPSDPRRSG